SLLPSEVTEAASAANYETLWSLQAEAAAIERAERQMEYLRADVWEPFQRCARVLDHFGYLDFAQERVTDRGRWLADLRVDRPLLVGETLQRDLFASLDVTRAAALVAALAAAEEGDLVRLLSRTGEALLQIAGLRQTHSKAAGTAATAAEIILRDPVR